MFQPLSPIESPLLLRLINLFLSCVSSHAASNSAGLSQVYRRVLYYCGNTHFQFLYLLALSIQCHLCLARTLPPLLKEPILCWSSKSSGFLYNASLVLKMKKNVVLVSVCFISVYGPPTRPAVHSFSSKSGFCESKNLG